MDISKALTLSRPASQWSLNGNTLDGLQWHGPGEPPTLDELQAAWDNRPIGVPDAERHQVRIWLAKNQINPANVPALIEDVTEDGPARWEALARWDSVQKIPFGHDMVKLLWHHLGDAFAPKTLEEVWQEILETH